MSSYKDLQIKIFERDNYTCRYCGKNSREHRALVMAHIRTASMCGDDRESNLITLCRHCYNHISNNEIRAKFETKENADYFWGLYHEKVKGYCYYTNYIKKVFTENGVLMTRPQIDKYVSIFVKNDDDFNAFKAELRNIGCEDMRHKMHKEMMRYKYRTENQNKE
jgi:hypothetical protein